jgi:AcrR family transcriptional regulator
MAQLEAAMSETRQNRQADRRQRILAAALDLFAQQGFHRTSTRQIAQAAGVAEGSIFNHFPTKKDLLVAVMAQIVDDYLGEDLVAPPKTGTLELLRETFRSRLELGWRHAERIRFLLGELLLNQDMRQSYFEAVILPLTDRVERLLEQRIAEGYVRPCNVRVVAGALVGAFLTFLLVAVLDEERRLLHNTLEEVSDELARLFLYGLRPEGQEA